METTNQNIDFSKNVRVSAEIQDLINLGWVLDDIIDAENHHIEITVTDESKTLWCIVKTVTENNTFEGSDNEDTGDDEQTIKDIQKLYSENKLWDIRIDY